MRIFVTGGTGFVGGHVIRLLAGRGHELRCLTRSPDRAEGLSQAGAAAVPGALEDPGSLRRGMEGCDCAIHLAAVYQFWIPDRRLYRQVNVEGTRNLMACAIEAELDKVVHVSTVGVWGRDAERPTVESTPFGSERFCEYFRSKYEGEKLAWELVSSRGLPLVVVYPGAIVGPEDPKATGEYISRLLRRRLPARVLDRSRLPIVHVRDVAEGIVRAAEAPANVGASYILAKHNPTFGELGELVSGVSGVPLPRLSLPDWMTLLGARILSSFADLTKKPPLLGMAYDQMRCMRHGYEVDGSRAERELGLSYTPLEDCVRDAVSSFL